MSRLTLALLSSLIKVSYSYLCILTTLISCAAKPLKSHSEQSNKVNTFWKMKKSSSNFITFAQRFAERSWWSGKQLLLRHLSRVRKKFAWQNFHLCFWWNEIIGMTPEVTQHNTAFRKASQLFLVKSFVVVELAFHISFQACINQNQVKGVYGSTHSHNSLLIS